MNDKKTIQVNNEYFSLSGNTKKREKSRKRPTKPKTLTNSSKIRKEFIKKVHDFQNKKNKEVIDKNKVFQQIDIDVDVFNTEFDKSIDFMQSLALKRANNRKSRRKKHSSNKSQHTNVSIEIPPELSSENIIKNTTQQIPINNNIISSPGVSIIMGKQPPYSNIKNGSKPTYRNWMKTQKLNTGTNNNQKPYITINDNFIKKTQTDRSVRLKELKKQRAGTSIKRTIKTKRITKTIKHKLGKSNKKVGVLIKSRETRKQINNDKLKLNKSGIADIKKYLRSKNFIRGGSSAPNDVLREMYEKCILTGDVTNKSADVLIHNYLHQANKNN